MGRQVSGTQMGEKHVSAKSDIMFTDSLCEAVISEDNIEGMEYEVKECTEENTDGCEFYEKQDASSVRVGKIVNLEDRNSGQKTSSPGVDKNKYIVPKPFKLATEKHACATRSTGVYSEGSDAICSPKASSVNSPRSIKSSHMNSPTLSRRMFQGDNKKFQDDDDDCWSLTSSAAGSVKTNKLRTTVASAPVFKCSERAKKRKEFYKKLEEKHRALEEERKQFEARIKEEQDAVLKQLRKNMTYKANPVPDFYRQGPPPKPELKKLPVTLPKSPKFNTSRRKSSSDLAASQVEEKEKVPARSVRHSTGPYKQESQAPSPINRKTLSNGRSRVSVSPPTPNSYAPNTAPPKMDTITPAATFLSEY